TLSASVRAFCSVFSASAMRCPAARLSSVAWRRALSDSVAEEERSCAACSGASWACVEPAFRSRPASGPARARAVAGSRRAGPVLDSLTGLGGDPLGLGARRGQRLVGLCTGLVQQTAGLLLGAGAQLLRPGHVLVDVRLDGLAALRELLVELLAARHGLGVQ